LSISSPPAPRPSRWGKRPRPKGSGVDMGSLCRSGTRDLDLQKGGPP
jgi:hypothetical protein